jgi:MarR family transcriptional regulator, negative regulator of the multidrug operon emrRAB
MAVRSPNGTAKSIVCLGTLARAEGLASAQIARVLREHDLSRTAYNALTVLAQAGRPLGPHELAEQLLVSPGAVTQLLDLLERQGRVDRRPHASDRRMSRVELTAAGRRVLSRAEPAVAAATNRTLAGLSGSEQQQLMRLLQKLERHVQTLE